MTTPASERDRARAQERPRANEAGGAARASSRRDRGSTTTAALAVDWDVSHVAATTLVTVRVENTTERPRRVRLDNRLDGSVAPPRRHGVPEPGWDDDGVTRLLPGGETLSVGYACQAPPETPPVTVHDEPSDGDDERDRRRGRGTGDTPVETVLRSLGAFAPPRAALTGDGPAPGNETKNSPKVVADGTDDSMDGTDEPGESTDATDPEDGADGADECASGPREHSSESTADPATRTRTGDPPAGATDVPTTVEAWFEAVEARLVTADRLAGDVREATPVLASLGGRAGVETLASRLDGDAAALRAVAESATALAARIDETDVPDVGARE